MGPKKEKENQVKLSNFKSSTSFDLSSHIGKRV
jgi:hypothetical protein